MFGLDIARIGADRHAGHGQRCGLSDLFRRLVAGLFRERTGQFAVIGRVVSSMTQRQG
jgi:hypothetical protein